MSNTKFRDLPRKSYQTLFRRLTLGEVQLLLLGLWTIGAEDRVDLKLLPEYLTLRSQLQIAGQTKAAQEAPAPTRRPR